MICFDSVAFIVFLPVAVIGSWFLGYLMGRMQP